MSTAVTDRPKINTAVEERLAGLQAKKTAAMANNPFSAPAQFQQQQPPSRPALPASAKALQQHQGLQAGATTVSAAAMANNRGRGI